MLVELRDVTRKVDYERKVIHARIELMCRICEYIGVQLDPCGDLRFSRPGW